MFYVVWLKFNHFSGFIWYKSVRFWSLEKDCVEFNLGAYT